MNVSNLVAKLDKETFSAGETIFAKGDPGSTMYVIVEGEVDVTYDGRRSVRLGADQTFGEMSLIDKRPRSAAATAVTDVTLAPISQGLFLVLVHDTPYFALEVMQSLSDRLRQANEMAGPEG